MRSPSTRLIPAVFAAIVLSLAATAPAIASPNVIVGDYIVTVADQDNGTQAAARHGVIATHTYAHVLRGFAAKLTSRQLNALRADPSVTRITANGVMTIQTTQPNPPAWGLDRIDQTNLPLSNSYTYNSTGANVHAYVIDTGIDIKVAEFGNRAVWDLNTAGGPNKDCHGHGTHVAGTIGSASYGVAKQVRLHAVKVLNCSGSGTFAGVIAGMDWVAANHISPAVANMSLGGGFDATVNAALDNLANSGVFVAVAAGNSGANACSFSPASAANATSVMASDINDNRASFSNFGSCTHLYAPGVSILSTQPRDGTALFSGTSMATPHVAGVAALYKATFGDAPFSTVRSWIVSHATAGVINGNPAGTPNLMLFTSGL
jgi:subtilisin family serine protease